jgi:methylglutaconyl-CoA hydratase
MARVDHELDGGVLTITLADEENRNTLSAELLRELVPVLEWAEDDETVRVVVLTNTGPVFCAGADLGEQTGRSGTGPADGYPVGPIDLFSHFGRSPKPYVGRIAGHCVAGGMGIAAGLDLCFAVDTAKMGFTEVRVGVAPAMISVLCLPKMRRVDAADAMLRGRRFLAPEAERMGLITAAVPADELDATVDAAVADLLAAGPGALAATKELLARLPEMTTADAFAWTEELSAELFRSDEAKEGMAAFLERRPPPWTTGG